VIDEPLERDHIVLGRLKRVLEGVKALLHQLFHNLHVAPLDSDGNGARFGFMKANRSLCAKKHSKRHVDKLGTVSDNDSANLGHLRVI
jgi:hypothetical protein